MKSYNLVKDRNSDNLKLLRLPLETLKYSLTFDKGIKKKQQIFRFAIVLTVILIVFYFASNTKMRCQYDLIEYATGNFFDTY